VPSATLQSLLDYDWPGNVRELKNVIERAAITSTGPDLRLSETLRAGPRETDREGEDSPFEALDRVERRYITRVLEATGWRISGPSGAALVLDLNPSTLRYRMKKLGICKPW
jgi:transcriptional regulator with GAF, ATPase, and Fis domain